MIKKRPYLQLVPLICLLFIVACRVETPAGEEDAQITNPAEGNFNLGGNETVMEAGRVMK